MIEQAAEAGDAQSAYIAASINSSFFWRERDWERALDFLVLAAESGHEAAQVSLQIIASDPLSVPQENTDWQKARSAIDLKPWLEPVSSQTISDRPSIKIIENFVSVEVCDWLQAQSRGSLSRATIYDKATGGNTEDERRTNTHCDLGIDKCGVLTFLIRARIAAVTAKTDQAMEIPKILHYFPGETFARHYDYLNPSEPAYANEIAQRGQRTETFLIYLNDDYEGGETHFYEIGLSHKGKKGDAILFRNVDEQGRPDEMTMHAGLPPKTGEKWIFSQWIRGTV